MACSHCKKGSYEENKENIDLLNSLLANEMSLYIKLYNYHWNVTGPNFSELHKLFQEQFTSLISWVDTIAERVRALHGKSLGTMQQFLDQSLIVKEGLPECDSMSMIKDLCADHCGLSGGIQKLFQILTENGDDGSANILLDVQDYHDKSAWMLRSYFEGI